MYSRQVCHIPRERETEDTPDARAVVDVREPRPTLCEACGPTFPEKAIYFWARPLNDLLQGSLPPSLTRPPPMAPWILRGAAAVHSTLTLMPGATFVFNPTMTMRYFRPPSHEGISSTLR